MVLLKLANFVLGGQGWEAGREGIASQVGVGRAESGTFLVVSAPHTAHPSLGARGATLKSLVSLSGAHAASRGGGRVAGRGGRGGGGPKRQGTGAFPRAETGRWQEGAPGQLG